MTDYDVFQLGDVDLQCGLRLRNAWLAYKTYGELNARRDNVVVFPTYFGSQHPANEPMIGPGMALDPSRHFIVVPNLFGNGLSPSPSNMPPPYDRARFPVVTYYDNVLVPAAVGGGAVWRRAGGAGVRVLDGGAAGVSLGGDVS